MNQKVKRTVHRTVTTDAVTRPMTADETEAFDKVFENFDATFLAVDDLFRAIGKKETKNG